MLAILLQCNIYSFICFAEKLEMVVTLIFMWYIFQGLVGRPGPYGDRGPKGFSVSTLFQLYRIY